MIFIANNVFNRVNEFKRIKTKSILNGKPLNGQLFLHFEARNDSLFMKSFLRVWSRNGAFDENLVKQIKFVYTPKKSNAISEHKDALEMGLNISTLVDMDHDIKEKSLKGLEKIHSTKYACTLFTMQFIDDKKNMDQEILLNVIQGITKLDDNKCNRIVKQALENTSIRLNKWRPYIMDDFAKRNITQPLNDHEVAFAILAEQGVKPTLQPYSKDTQFMQQMYGIEEKIRAYALIDQNGLVRRLLKNMLTDLTLN